MNIPGFNAEASLYKTSGHYQTSRQVFNLPAPMARVISSALNEGGRTVDCDTCVGGECVGCLEKMLHKGEFGGLDPGGGGGGGGGGPVEPCLSHDDCTPCVSQGPSIFSPGRRFCQHSICQPTASGGCSCTVFKGFERCTPTRNTGVLQR
jgi:hypothetical protein